MPRSGCRILASLFCLQVFAVLGISARGDDVQKLLEKPRIKPPEQCAAGPFVSPELSSVSEKTQRIRRALQTQVELQFPDNTLEEVRSYLSQIHGIEVVIDEPRLKFVNRSGEDTVHVSLANVTLAKALEKILEETTPGDQLDFVIDDDKLVITTADAASDRTETRLFGLQEFLAAGMNAQDLAQAARQVADTEHGVVATGNILVVTLNQRSQEKILDLLVSLRWAVLKQAFTQTTAAPNAEMPKPKTDAKTE